MNRHNRNKNEMKEEMKTHVMMKFAVAFMAIAPMIVFPETSRDASKSTSGEMTKQHKRKPSVFKKEFLAWADKQDWFALSDTAEFGDPNRKKKAENGMSFGYSVEFLDSKGRRFILGVGLAKEPEVAAKKEMKRDMAEMSATKNLMMHGIPVTTDASGKQSRSVSGTVNTAQILSTTIVKPETEEKWFLCVCTKFRGAKKTTSAPKGKDQ